MIPRLKRSHAFTLAEVLVSMILIGIVATASLQTFTVLGPTADLTDSRIKAQDILSKSQEEVRAYAQTNYGTLDTCFVGNPCNFSNVSTDFPGFTRTMGVLSSSTNDLKKILISVSWNEYSKAQQVDSILYLAKPADPMPGNLIGLVMKEGTSNLLPGAKLILTEVGNPSHTLSSTNSTATKLRTTLPDINYSFEETGTGRFTLPSGPTQWKLSVSLNGYYDQDYPNPIVISSNSEQNLSPIYLKPKPADAHIIVQIFDQGTGRPVVVSDLDLFQNGSASSDHQVSSVSSYDFTVHFSDTNPQCFTVATFYAYRKGYAGQFTWGGFNYQANGFSTAAKNGPSNPWQGNSSSDSVCVNPADSITQPIFLVPVPTNKVQGVVRDQDSKPIPGAVISAIWHDGTQWVIPNTVGVGTTDANGHYEVNVPAEQEMFPTFSNYYVRLKADGNVPVKGCCSETYTAYVSTPWTAVGPITLNSPELTQDFALNISAQVTSCGNVQGNVLNDKSGDPVNGASIALKSLNNGTDNSGRYLYQCLDSSKGRRVQTGPASVVIVRAGGFYDYSSGGNSVYAPNPSIMSFNITEADEDVNHLPPIGLWPIGRGDVQVRILNKATKAPIANIAPFITLNNGTTIRMPPSDASGLTVLNSIPETWPPAEVVGNPKYVQNTRSHVLVVPETSTYQAPPQVGFNVTANSLTSLVVELEPKDGF